MGKIRIFKFALLHNLAETAESAHSSAVPVFGEVDWVDDDNPEHYHRLELKVSLERPSRSIAASATTTFCTSVQLKRRYYNRHVAKNASLAMIGNVTNFYQSYWRPDTCFDSVTADWYFRENFVTWDFWITGAINIVAYGAAYMVASDRIPALLARMFFANQNWDVIELRPTYVERWCAKYKPWNYTWLLQAALNSINLYAVVDNVVKRYLIYSPRFLQKESGWVTRATPVLIQVTGSGSYTVGDDAPEAQYCIHEAVGLLSKPTICNIERKELVFHQISHATAHAASRIGQNLTVWRSWYDPSVCNDAESSAHKLGVDVFVICAGVYLLSGLMGVAISWQRTGFCWGWFRATPEVKDVTISDEYALFQTRSQVPKPRRQTHPAPMTMNQDYDDDDDPEAPKDR